MQASALPLGHFAIYMRRADLKNRPESCDGADNGARTRDPNLGKVVLYQLSHVRLRGSTIREFSRVCKRQHLLHKRIRLAVSRVDLQPHRNGSHIHQDSALHVALSPGTISPVAGSAGPETEEADMPKKGKRKAPERSYARLARHERNTIELMLDRGASCRSIAAELGRAPSTVSNEVAAHRFVVAPRARAGEPAPEGLGDACERLRRWPRCCNGCRRRKGYGCGRSPRVAYVARLAQEAADRELVESRRGVDEGEAGFAMKVGTIRSCMARGLSPAQIA